jgi:tetratricopeptide (TPR) repeat protein
MDGIKCHQCGQCFPEGTTLAWHLDSEHYKITSTTNIKDEHIEQGITLIGAERVDEAISEFGMAIEINRNNVDAYLKRGRAYIKLSAIKSNSNYLNKAIDDFNKAIKLSPANPLAYHSRGGAYH